MYYVHVIKRSMILRYYIGSESYRFFLIASISNIYDAPWLAQLFVIIELPSGSFSEIGLCRGLLHNDITFR
jgi:hypothetical protein